MTAIITIKNGKKVVSNGMHEEKILLEDINLTINEGDFITVLGGNGAGKSTLFNTIAGTLELSQGTISFKDQLITKYPEEKRAAFLSRVFQDPKMGMEDALNYGNRLIVLQKGRIVKDLTKEEKAQLSMSDLLQFFEEVLD